MKFGLAGVVFLGLIAAPLAAQTPALIAMDQEPHHHLKLQNDFVKVFDVHVAPGDSIILHRHDGDTVAIAVGEQLVTVGIPGKPGVPSKNADGQVRLQAGGYIHSTHVDGTMPYHTVAVELLHPQTNFHNVCAAAMVGKPMNCPDAAAAASSQTLLESDQTSVRMVRVPAGQSSAAGDLKALQLIVALDAGALSAESGKGAEQSLQSGDFVWLANGPRTFKNTGKGEARLIGFSFHSN